MSAKAKLDRRGFLARGLAVASAALVGGCDSELSEQPWVKRILDKAETLTLLEPAGARVANGARPRIWRGRHLEGLQGERLDRGVTMTTTGRLPRTDLPTGS